MKQRYTKLKSVALAALTMGLALGAQAGDTDCITFSADKSFGIKLRVQGNTRASSLEYSTDQLNWTQVTVGCDYAAAQDGDTYKIHFRGKGNTSFARFSTKYNYYAFTNTADSAATAIACSGNALTLLDYATVAKGEVPTMENHAFACLFRGFAALTAAPALPATTLTQSCYYQMFLGCTSLTAAPALPATTLAKNCYYGMFNGCTSLVVNKAAPGKEWKVAATPGDGVTSWGDSMFADTGGDVTGAPDLNTTYYVGAKKETVGDVTLYRYGDQVGVSVAGELTKEMADSIKDQGITNLVIGTGVTGVGAEAFEGWRSLRSVTAGAACAAVGEKAFHKCYNVTNVTCAAAGVAVGDYAFLRCNSLQSLAFAEMPTWGATPFAFHAGIRMDGGMPEVYAVPQVTISGYKQVLRGSTDLTTWNDVTTEQQKKDYKFFKIELRELE